MSTYTGEHGCGNHHYFIFEVKTPRFQSHLNQAQRSNYNSF